MTYRYLREERRGLQIPLLEIFSALLLLAAIVWGMLELVRYSNEKDTLATDLTIAQIPLGGQNESQARARLEAIYQNQPVQLYYDGAIIEAEPATLGFTLNTDSMMADATAGSTLAQDFWTGFVNFLSRKPVAAVTVPLDYTFQESELRLYLEEIAARYDSEGGESQLNTTTLTFTTGNPARHLDIEQAVPLIEQALRDPQPENRRVTLPTFEQNVRRVSMDDLRQGIIRVMESYGFANTPDKIASAYVMDLSSGDEISINGDVVYSATSVIKIPIMINLFREQLGAPPDDIAYLLTESILCSNNASSNFLIQYSGYDAQNNTEVGQLSDGLNDVSCSAQEFGARHTYISAPLDINNREIQFEAPVCRPSEPASASVADDPYSQTTVEDMGWLLTSIYDCANHDSGLRAIDPDNITQTECQQMLEVLSGNRINRLLELGLPEGTEIAHKNGWGPETTGDAGIVFSPGGDYVIAVYAWEPDLDNNGVMTIQAWEMIEEISRLVYNYFNPTAALYERREPIYPFTAIDCVTVMSPDQVDLNDIDKNRVDENGDPLPGACYGGAASFNAATGECLPWNGWGND